MERRKAIFEQIKDTKLNKLTIKQGEINIKLNLKRDLIDPNVEISKKALEMLEEYAKKNGKNRKSCDISVQQSSNSSTTSQFEENNRIQVDSVEEFFQSNSKCMQTSEDNKLQFYHKDNQFIECFGDFKSNDNQLNSTEKTLVPEIQEKEDHKKEQRCRLCKLKISNERALHEHVSRIHGGKKAFSILSKKDNLKLNRNSINQEYDFSDIEEIESMDEAYLSSSSDTKRKKNTKPIPPRPNVAIRVAKVAYYNSKGTINSNNPFKLNIFKNGGLRGNFFSQERLPLKSCKIKMKITNSKFNIIDEFLMNTHEIMKIEYIESNKTQTMLSSYQDANKNDQILTDRDIKDFFKTLLDYIPLKNNLHLEDLVKENELFFSEIAKYFELDINESVQQIYEIILNTKQYGINLFNLKKEANKKIKTKNAKEIQIIVLKKILKILIDNHLLLAVGVIERVYVANEFKKHWVIESFKSLRGRGNLNDHDSSNENENITNELHDLNNGERIKEIKSNLKNFKPICIIPRPWRYIDGLLNRPVLKKMLESIMLYLKTNPNSSFNSISSHFCPVLQPIMTLELLEMLEQLKCVKKIAVKNEKLCDLLSDFNNGSRKVINDEDLDGDEIFSYYLNQSSIFNIKKVFPN